MSMGRTRLQGRTLTHDEFMRKHESELLESDKDSVTGGTISLGALMKGKDLPGPSETLPLPISALLVQLHRWWLVRLLGAAARENSPEAYGSLLGYWLHKMGVDPPAGVFLRAPGKPGRPRSAMVAVSSRKNLVTRECSRRVHRFLARPALPTINLARARNGGVGRDFRAGRPDPSLIRC
jgi:hypothetical protein